MHVLLSDGGLMIVKAGRPYIGRVDKSVNIRKTTWPDHMLGINSMTVYPVPG
jgi:hypothetical protein